jgi:hypothetical protein
MTTIIVLLLSAPIPAPAETRRPIQDNSFLVEEAYNQEHGVVQHVSAFFRERGGAFAYTFTQEWPVPGQRHQVSVTLPIVRVVDPEPSTGLGDAALNYRYQWIGSGEARIAVAPRVSLLLPTGTDAKGRGTGGVGVQLNLPVSVALGERLVAHSNAGLTMTASARSPRGDKAWTTGVNLGQSLIWLTAPNLNLMLEVAWTRDQDVVGPDRTEARRSFYLSPAVRGAIDFPSGLQIVPGLAVPIGVGPSRGDRGIFLYLSFEHPFREE